MKDTKSDRGAKGPGGRSLWGRVVRAGGRIAALFGGLLVIMTGKMLLTSSPQPSRGDGTKTVALGGEDEAARLAERLAQALRIPTVSAAYDAPPSTGGEQVPPPRAESAPQAALRQLLATLFPRVHQALKVEVLTGGSLLFQWTGSDPARAPYLLLAHMDVVPVEAGTEAAWTHPPFAGVVQDGYIWGRGALDDKQNVLSILESVERLLSQGVVPARTVYIALGHDEEVNGEGARTMAALLQSRGVHCEFALDEGQAIVRGILPGLSAPVGLIGLAEKGYLSVEISSHSEGGHSSIPPAHTAAGTLARAVTRIEAHPFPAKLSGPPKLMFSFVGPQMALPLRFLLTNLWLTQPLLEWQLAQNPTTHALLHTTTAVTMLQAGTKDNVLPQQARAVVNFRLFPGDTEAVVMAHLRKVVDDPQLEMNALSRQSGEASPVSSTTSPAFALLGQTIRQLYPDTLVAPSLMLGASDARHYVQVATDVYRFMPTPVTSQDLPRIHGTNERIAVSDYHQSVRFYEQLMRNADAGGHRTPGSRP